MNDAPFTAELLRQIRAHDSFGAWDGKSDAEILAPFLLSREERRAIPVIDDPDPDVLWRLELFYAAVALGVERRTRVVAAPLMKIGHEGFGRVVLTAGRLVVLSRHLRDVHRFGFDDRDVLEAEGRRLVDEAVSLIEQWPDLARA